MNPHEQGWTLSAYVDGELEPALGAAVEAHLDGCAECRMELESLREVRRRLAAAPRREAPGDLVRALEARHAGGASAGELSRALAALRIMVPVGLAAAAMLGVAFWLGGDEGAGETLPLEPLLAAHTRYKAESEVSGADLVAANFSAQLAAYQEDEK